MKIIHIERMEMPTPRHPTKPSLLVNVHLAERSYNAKEMQEHAIELIKSDLGGKYGGIAVVYWLQAESHRERLYVYEI